MNWSDLDLLTHDSLKAAHARTHQWIVARLGSRRLGVPALAVKGVGRVESRDVLVGKVRSSKDPKVVYDLLDLRQALGLAGESGGVFVAVWIPGFGEVAWAVDAIEPKLLQIEPNDIRPALGRDPRYLGTLLSPEGTITLLGMSGLVQFGERSFHHLKGRMVPSSSTSTG